MSASISTKTGKASNEFIRKFGSYVAGGVKDYFVEAAPVTSGIITDTKSTITEIKGKLPTKNSEIFQNIKKIKQQIGFKSVYNWFMQKDSEFDIEGEDYNFDFDDGTSIDNSTAEIAGMQIGEEEKSSDKISKMILESSQKSVEANLNLTSNILDKIEKQTAVITTGFDSTNSKLDEILKVLTRNTSAILESQNAIAVANKKDEASPTENILNNKFNLGDYKKILQKNLSGNMTFSTAQMAMSMLPMLLSPDAFSPQDMIKGLFGMAVNKANPKFKDNVKAFDDAVNQTIISSLLRIGESTNSFRNPILSLFGIDGSRKSTDTARSELKLGKTDFDTITKESITNAIPGYLRKILFAVSGKDEVYDYRSRSFKTIKDIENQFRRASSSTDIDILPEKLISSFENSYKNDSDASMAIELLLNDLEGRAGSGGNLRKIISDFRDKNKFRNYMIDNIYNGQASRHDIKDIDRLVDKFTKAITDPSVAESLYNNIATNNLNKNKGMKDYVNNANAYNVDLSFLRENAEENKKYIRSSYDRKDLNKGSVDIKSARSEAETKLSGFNYTNKALFEIHRILSKGINVFKVGEETTKPRSTPFPDMRKFLPPPFAYKPKEVNDPGINGEKKRYNSSNAPKMREPGDDNPLENNIDPETGEQENLSRGQRLGRWAKVNGKNLMSAMFFGNPEDVKKAFSDAFSDVAKTGAKEAKKSLNEINDSFGNVKGYIKHKLFGSEYSYVDTEEDENGNKKTVIKKVKKNEKGGLFGFATEHIINIFKSTKDTGAAWFKDVKSYFDYGDDKKEDKDVNSKRKKLIATSVGSLAGLGILGGPLGILMGGVAGAALQNSDLGSKIKEKLLGRDKETGEAKGLVAKAMDKIFTPVEYMFKKGLHNFGNVLKKNIFGPLSDIGWAIKERTSSAVSNVFKKFYENTLGKLFSGIGKGAKWLVGKGTGLLGFGEKEGLLDKFSGAYGTMKGEKMTAIPGIGMKAASRAIIGLDKDKQKELSERVKKREDGIKNDKFAENKEEFVKNKNKKRVEAWSSINEYTKETVEVVSEGNEISSNIEKNTAESTSILGNIFNFLKNPAAPGIAIGGNFNNKDQKDNSEVSEENKEDNKKNEIVPSNGDKKHKKKSSKKSSSKKSSIDNKDDSEGFANSAVTAASTIAMSGDIISNEESRKLEGVVDEAGSANSKKKTIKERLKSLINLNGKNKEKSNDDSKKEKKSFLSSILGGFDSIVGKIGGLGTLIAGIVGYSDIKSLWDNVIKGDMDLKQWWGEESTIGTAIHGIMDISKFIGRTAGPLVNTMSRGIEGLTRMIPFMPTITPPQINTDGPLAGLATGMLGGLYLKGIHAAASAANAVINLKRAASESASNLVDNLTGGSKWGSRIKTATNVAMGIGTVVGVKNLAENIAGGGYQSYENTSAGGDKIVNTEETRRGYLWTTNGMRDLVIPKGSELLKDTLKNKKAVDDLADAGISAVKSKSGKILFKDQSGKFVSDKVLSEVTGEGKDELLKKVGSSLGKQGDDLAEAAATGGKGICAKVFNAVKTALTKFRDFITHHKSFQKFASKVKDLFDPIIAKVNAGGMKILEKMPNKLQKIMVKGEAGDATGVATAFIGKAVQGVAGGISGALSAANIFGVREKDVDGKMRIVASAIVAAINAIPKAWALEVLDLITIPLLGKSMRQLICQGLYKKVLGGSEELIEKQEKFQADISDYNSTYGTDLSTEEYNDMVNKGAFGKIFGYGAVKTDEEGKAMFDEAGNVIRTGHGIAGWFTGTQKEYAKDANGNIIRDENGKAVQAVDANGNKILKDAKWTNKLSNGVKSGFKNVGRFFFGGEKYKTDENGQAIYNEETQSFETEKEKNIFGKAFDGIKGLGKGLASGFSSIAGINEDDSKGEKALKAIATANPITAPIMLAKFGVNKVKGIFKKQTDEMEEASKELDEEVDDKKEKTKFKDSKLFKGLKKGAEIALKSSPFAVAFSFAKAGINKIKNWIGKQTDEIASASEELNDVEKMTTDSDNPLEIKEIDDKGRIVNIDTKGIGKKVTLGSLIVKGLKSSYKHMLAPFTNVIGAIGGFTDADGTSLGDKIKGVFTAFGKIFDDTDTNLSGVNGLKSKITSLISEFTNALGFGQGAPDYETWSAMTREEQANYMAEHPDEFKNVSDEQIAAYQTQEAVETNGTDKLDDTSSVNKKSKESLVTGAAGNITSYAVTAAKNAMRENERNGSSITSGNSPFSSAYNITSGYGHPDNRVFGDSMHTGVDIVPTNYNDKGVYSLYDGEIVDVKNGITATAEKDANGNYQWNGSSEESTGNMVSIRLADGTIIRNMHLAEGSIPATIQVGTKIKAGDLIGQMGNTGKSSGEHLHYEVVDAAGNSIDPTTYLNGSASISPNAMVGDPRYAAPSSETPGVSSSVPATLSETGTNTSSGGTTSDDGGTTRSGLGGIIDTLMGFGSNLLSAFTGGLLGSSSGDTSSTSGSTSSGSHGGGGASRSGTTGGSIGTPVMLSSKSNPRWLEVVQAVKAAVASFNPVYYDSSNNSYSDINVNGEIYHTRNDCSGITSVMLQVYGSFKKGRVENSAGFRDLASIDGFDKADFPGWESLVPGDILVINNGSEHHVEVFGSLQGGKHLVWSGGSTKSLRNPSLGESGHKSYQYIFRPKETSSTGTITMGTSDSTNGVSGTLNGKSDEQQYAVPGLENLTDPSSLPGSNTQEIFTKLRQRGFSNEAAAGITGNWDVESHNDPRTVEGYYLKKYPGYSSVMKDQEALNSYTKDILWPALRASGVSVKESGYTGPDGNLYPGLGFAQWTGGRHIKLRNWADQRGEDWRTTEGQLDFMESELKEDSYTKAKNALETGTDPATIADAFSKYYEGATWDHDERLANARTNYEKYSITDDQLASINSTGTSTTGTNGGSKSSTDQGGPDKSTLSKLNAKELHQGGPDLPKKQTTATIGTQKFERGGESEKTSKGEESNIQSKINQIGNKFQETVSNIKDKVSDTFQNGNIEEITDSLYKIIECLQSITTNTGNSTTLLQKLNQDGIQDKGMREAFSKAGSAKGKSYYSSNSGGNNRMITNMAKP